MTFKVGDKVMIARGSQYDIGTQWNPTNTIGVVRRVHDNLIKVEYVVRWSTGMHNVYGLFDLVRASYDIQSR